MKNTWKKLLAMTLVASMLTGMLGVGTLAIGEENKGQQVTSAGDAYSIRKDTQASAISEGGEEHIHAWKEESVRIEPTCTTAGEKLFRCTLEGCNEARTEQIPALGHDWDEGVEEAGIITYTCRRCKEIKTVAMECTCVLHCGEYPQTVCEACKVNSALCQGKEIQQPEGWSAEFNSETQTLTINGNGELTMEILDSLVFEYSDTNGVRLLTLNSKDIVWDVNGLVRKLVIGEGITAIGESVFDGNIATGNGPRYLANVTEIVLPDGLVSIGDFAFDSCGSQGETFVVNFPSSLESIGRWAFEYCEKLKRVEISASNVEIGAFAFYGCAALEKVQISEAKEIGENAFAECMALKEITISSPDVVIGKFAFWSCSYLETISVTGAKEIDDYAFQACYSLKSVTLENVNRIGMCVLSGNWEADGYYEYYGGPESLSIKNVETISDYAFQACENLKTVSLENVETVGQDAFFQCYALEHVDLTNVGTVMGYAFEQCALESVAMNKVGTISRNAFYYNENLTTVTGLDTVERIDGFAFFGCSNLTGLTVADATKMGFNGDNYADVMERVQDILNGSFILDDVDIEELTLETGWTDGKVGKSEKWNTYDHGTQLREQARWTNDAHTEAEVELTSYYTAKEQMDYIYVVDLSASMAQLGNLKDDNARFYDMQSKMLDMTDKLLNAPGYDCRVAFVTFGGAVLNNDGSLYADAISEIIPFTEDADTAAASIKALKPLDQNTDYFLAMEKTLDLAKTNGGRNTTVIFMSDGQPVVDGKIRLTTGTLAAYREKVAAKAAEIENLGINIYGVLHSVPESEHDNAVKAMEAVCTEGLFFEATNTAEFSQSVNAAMNAANGGTYTVSIPVHSDFENVNGLTTSNPDDVVTVENGIITWTVTGMPFTKHTLTYKMSLTAENAGRYGDQSYSVNNGKAITAGGAEVETPVLTRSVERPYEPDDPEPTRRPTPSPEPTSTPEPTETPEPTPAETSVIEDLGENDTPLAELPAETEQPATEPPKEEFEDLEDEDVPLAQVPETGDSLGTWLMMSAGALLGLAWLGRKREEA